MFTFYLLTCVSTICTFFLLLFRCRIIASSLVKLVIAKRRDRSLRNILNTPYVTFGAFTGIRTKAVRVEVRVSSISIKEEKLFRRGVLDPLLAVGYFRPRLKLRKIRSRDVVSRARAEVNVYHLKRSFLSQTQKKKQCKTL